MVTVKQLRVKYDQARTCMFCGHTFKRPLKCRFMGGKQRVCARCLKKIDTVGIA
jgi:hypothetical protein